MAGQGQNGGSRNEQAAAIMADLKSGPTEADGIQDCCTSGHLHSGIPIGRVQQLYGFRTYVCEPYVVPTNNSSFFPAEDTPTATPSTHGPPADASSTSETTSSSEPTSNQPASPPASPTPSQPTSSLPSRAASRSAIPTPPKHDVLLFIADFFGIYFVNSQLVATEWAKMGFKVVMPDITTDGPIGIEHLAVLHPVIKKEEDGFLTSMSKKLIRELAVLSNWLPNNPESIVKPRIERFAKALRDDPTTGNLGVVGFCWGGRYSCLLAKKDAPVKFDCAIAYHPSFLAAQDLADLEVPLAIFQGTNDSMLPMDELERFQEIITSQLADRSWIKTFEGASHGFTLRGNMGDAKQQQQKDEAFADGASFVRKYFYESGARVRGIGM